MPYSSCYRLLSAFRFLLRAGSCACLGRSQPLPAPVIVEQRNIEPAGRPLQQPGSQPAGWDSTSDPPGSPRETLPSEPGGGQSGGPR
jgi:hypothetical protein